MLDDLALGALRHRDHRARPLRGLLGQPPPSQAFAQSKPLGMRGKRHVVDRDDGRQVQRKRRRIRGTKPDIEVILPNHPGQSHLLPPRPGSAWNQARTETPRIELGADGGLRVEHELVAASLVTGPGPLVEEAAQVSTDAGGAARQLARIDSDPHQAARLLCRRRAIACSYAARTRCTVRAQRNSRARAIPRPTHSAAYARSASSRAMPAAISSGRSGLTRVPAPPTTSGSDPRSAATTGTPADMASSTGIPKPSSNEGMTSSRAPS